MQQTIEGFRLSLQQERLWLLQQQNNAYHAYCSVVIEGHLHTTSLRHALEAVFRRHTMYRTRFQRLPGVKLPVQVVNASPLYDWSHYDIKVCSPEEQQRQMDSFFQNVIDSPVDLERDAFIQCSLFALQEDKYVLFVFLHALYTDASTLCNFTEEVARFYSSEKSAVFSRTSEDKVVQYLHFSERQHALIEEDQDATDNASWREKHSLAFAPLALPFEHPASKLNSFSPAFQVISIASDICAQIDALLVKLQCSLPVFLLSCWQVLLGRLTARDDLLIGLTVDGRIYEELATIAGLLVKDMPFVCHLAWDLSFSELLTQTNEIIDELHSLYPYFSWEDLERAPSSANASLLYPFGFDFREYPTVYKTQEVLFSLQQCYACHEPFKVKMVAVRKASRLDIEMHYDANVLDKQDIQHVALQFTTLVEHAVKHSDIPISELEMMSTAELNLLLTKFNQTNADYPQNMCLHHLFEKQVERTPDAVALYDGERQITYRGLNYWANRVARYLQKSGVQPETLIGLYLPHSIELLVSIFGVLKAGAAYVPFDPISPRKRLISIATDAHITILLTSHAFLSSAPEAKQIVCLDDDWHLLAQWDGELAPINCVMPTNLAYVIYTSGSTGQPKGVMVSHQGLVHYVNWACKRYGVAMGTGTPLHSSLAFDLTVSSLFPALLVGRSLWLIPEEAGVDGLVNTMRAGLDFSLVKLTPAHLALLNQSLTSAEIANTTRMLVLGGETLKAESVAVWRLQAPETRLINEYGPTETVVGCCVYEVPREGEVPANVPIGRPISNTQIYLLDLKMHPVPLGVVGEVYIGGIGLGRGYLNCADLTAEHFVPHPFSLEPGARLYKTGDLARYVSADGDLAYVGRVDRQIKIRGYRIEPGEIEDVLVQHPAIRECVVEAHEDDQGNQWLVAYIIGIEPGHPLAVSQLREYMREYLPGYMVPTSFIFLQAFPLTINGKVDRRALPAPERSDFETDVRMVPARTPVEEIVLTIYREILGREQISIHDGFFDRGGHSLLATQVISRIRAIMGVELSVRSLFETPSAAGLAKQIEQKLRGGQERVMPPLVPVAREQDLPLSFAQQRLWFQEQLTSGRSAYVSPLTMRLHGPLQVAILEKCLQEMVRRHESLRTVFVTRSGQPAQIIRAYLHTELTVIDLQVVEEDKQFSEVLQFLNRELLHPFDLHTGPLLRMSLLRLRGQEHILSLVMHHLIFDGWSTGIFFRELSILYKAFMQGQPSPLSPPLLQYADFAFWQRQWLQGEVLDTLIAYWTKQLRGAVPLEMPTDRPRAASMSNRGAIYPFTVSSDLWQKLEALSRQEGVTLFMTLLTAFQILLYRSTGQQDIVVGTDSADRTVAETEQMVGFFVNLLALRVRLNSRATFHETVRSVYATVLGAYTHQALPFEKLVDALQLERSPHHMPLVNVLFVLQNVPQQLPELPDLTVRPVDVEIHTAKFEIAMFLMERAQEIIGYVNYNTDLFDSSSIAQLCLHFETLLQSIVASPDVPLEKLEMFTEEEKEQNLSKEILQQEVQSRKLKGAKRRVITMKGIEHECK